MKKYEIVLTKYEMYCIIISYSIFQEASVFVYLSLSRIQLHRISSAAPAQTAGVI